MANRERVLAGGRTDGSSAAAADLDGEIQAIYFELASLRARRTPGVADAKLQADIDERTAALRELQRLEADRIEDRFNASLPREFSTAQEVFALVDQLLGRSQP